MDSYYDVALSLENQSLCLFVGAGFSKQVTGQQAPSWLELLTGVCEYLKDPKKSQGELAELFKLSIPLEDCAHVLDLRFRLEGKSFRQSIADYIGKRVSIDARAAAPISEFLRSHYEKLCIISTNYDEFTEQLIPDLAYTNFPGRAALRKHGKLEVMHVHGCVTYPEGLIATTEDYYRFINRPDYFSRRVFTTMAENTVVILGYALGDPNLKSLLNAFYMEEAKGAYRSGVYYVTRNPIPQGLRDHYEQAYGLVCIDRTTIPDFLAGVSKHLPDAKEQLKRGPQNLHAVMKGERAYTDQYLKTAFALPRIVATANEEGIRLDDQRLLTVVGDLLSKKAAFTGEDKAWPQYEQLANWLIYVGSLLRVRGTVLERPYLNAVEHSFRTLTHDQEWARSWAAGGAWRRGWQNLMMDNRLLIMNTPPIRDLPSATRVFQSP